MSWDEVKAETIYRLAKRKEKEMQTLDKLVIPERMPRTKQSDLVIKMRLLVSKAKRLDGVLDDANERIDIVSDRIESQIAEFEALSSI